MVRDLGKNFIRKILVLSIGCPWVLFLRHMPHLKDGLMPLGTNMAWPPLMVGSFMTEFIDELWLWSSPIFAFLAKLFRHIEICCYIWLSCLWKHKEINLLWPPLMAGSFMTKFMDDLWLQSSPIFAFLAELFQQIEVCCYIWLSCLWNHEEINLLYSFWWIQIFTESCMKYHPVDIQEFNEAWVCIKHLNVCVCV